MKEASHTVTIRRIEDGYAVLRTKDGAEIFFPASLLPELKEGDSFVLRHAPSERSAEASSPLTHTGSSDANTSALAKAILNEILGGVGGNQS